MSKPNVVFLVLDSLRKDRLSVYNQDVDFTGNIEAFSLEATVVRDAVSCSPWTLPSHTAFFTGEYPWEIGTTQRNLSVNYDGETLAERLSERGYRSACVSVNGWLSGQFDLTRGFDEVDNLSTGGFSEGLTKARRWMDEWLASEGFEPLKRLIVSVGNRLFHYWNSGSRTGDVLSRCKDFIEEDDEPFFIFANLMDAHEPYFPPEDYRERHGAPDPKSICQDPTDHHKGRKKADFEAINRIYNASVDYLDDQIGSFLDYLKNQELWDDTIVIVTSDHGQMLGENGEYGHQFSVADPLIEVPLIVKGIEDGEIDSQVELRQLPEMIVDLVESEEPELETEFAKTGYDFPGMMRPRIPRDRWGEFFKRFRAVRTCDSKLTEEESESGERKREFSGKDDEREELESQIDSIRFPDEGESLDEKSEEIQQKLKNLGYG